MAERVTIARPYARAAFAHAEARRDFERWSKLLTAAATVSADEQVQKLLASPLVTPAQLASLIAELVGARQDDDGFNFLSTLAQNRRLGLLPEIAAIYETLRAEVENVADVQVTSAVALETAQRDRLAQALTKRLKREVRLNCVVDASLIGGAIVRSGDLVIDGSLKAQVERLAAAMTN
jgi:F-type H+-transporting ATPase subunit delta